ncbi:MAG: hypothetical protein NVS2B8_00240 [Vulcanimicrobiaceae bacterium]
MRLLNYIDVRQKSVPPSPATNGVVAHTTDGSSVAQEHVPLGNAVKLSVNVTRDVGQRLRRIAFDERVSESSIVEIALSGLFDGRSDTQLGMFLRDHGASLRRPVRD